MLLSARMLNDVGGVNSFDYVQIAQASQGDTVDIYFQLIDASKNQSSPNSVWSPTGLRYMPAAGATLQASLRSIDDAKTVTRFCSQPFVQDPSIWRLSLLASDVLVGTFGLALTLIEGSRQTRGYLAQAIQLQSQNQSFC